MADIIFSPSAARSSAPPALFNVCLVLLTLLHFSRGVSLASLDL